MQQPTPTSLVASAPDAGLVAAVALVCRTMPRLFGAKWVADEHTPAVWERALTIAGITPEQIRHGLARTSQLEWPPSPGQFIALCRPAAPSEGEALAEAVRWASDLRHEFREWSHPAIGAAARDIGDWTLRQTPDRELRRLWSHTYRQMLDRFHAGEELTTPTLRALTHQRESWIGRRTPDSPVAAECLDKLRRHFRLAEEPAS